MMIRLSSLSNVRHLNQKLLYQNRVCLQLQRANSNKTELASRICSLRPSVIRFLTYTHRCRQNDLSSRGVSDGRRPSQSASDSVEKPATWRNETVGKDSLKTDALLSDQRISHKEQRQADWAILKEMSKYLWPKVRLLAS